jgi:NHLM bacteriocin system ABC transporter peptidase/ATP-binding protein
VVRDGVNEATTEASAKPRRQGRHHRVRTPTVLQMEAVECGAAALGIVLGHFGRTVPLEELRVRCGVSRDGSKAGNVLRAARDYGLSAKGLRLETTTVLKGPFPLIVFWNFNHFLVVEGASRSQVWLNDPAIGPRAVSIGEFDESFTGVVLRLEPGPDFERGGRQPSVLARLGRWLSGSNPALGFVLAISLLMVVPGIVIPGFTLIFIDHYLVREEQDWLRPLLVGMLIVFVARWGLLWLQQYSLRRIELRLALANSARFLWHVLRLPVEFFQQRYVGDVSNRVNANDRVATLLSGDLGSSLLDALTILFFIGAMVFYDLSLTLISVGFAVINVTVMLLVRRLRTDLSMRLQQEQAKLFGSSVAGLQLVETLKASGGEDDFFARWAGYQARVANTEQRLSLVTQITAVVPTFLAAASTAAILGLGGLTVMEGGMTIGALVAFQSLVVSFNTPIQRLVEVGGRVQEINADLARLDDVMAYERDHPFRNEVDGAPTSPAPTSGARLDGRVTLENIAFGYNRLDPPLIEGFSLTLEPGGRIALVGGSGSGKSTLAKLATGLYPPWEGTLKLDGVPLADLPRDLVANSLSVVDQDIFLFEGTVSDNLTLWDPSVPHETVTQAAKDAAVHDVIAARPEGYDGPVDEGGRNFSGGEAQRLEIARALVTEPSILVLDEATSALDPATEALVFDSLRRRGCSCIVIAHRLSTIRDCDEIIVLDRGKVVERGRHAELIAGDGPYARLIAMQ